MSVRRHEPQTRTSDSGHGVLAVWLPFCGAGSLKLTVAGYWSWWRVMLPFLAFLGPQRGVFPGWLPMLLLAEAGRRRGGTYHRAEAFEGRVQHSGAVISLPVFGQPVATRRRTSLEGFWPCSGRFEVVVLFGMLSGGTVCVLVSDCQRPQSRARLKP